MLKAWSAGSLLALMAAGPWSVGYAKSIEEVVRTTLGTHPQVSAAEANRRVAEQERSGARGGYLPRLDFSANYGRERSNIAQLRASGDEPKYLTHRESGLTLTQVLFDGFATRSEVERRSALLAAAASRVDETQEAIALRAVEVYLDVVKRRELVKLAEANLAYHRDILGKVRSKVKHGVGDRADEYQAVGRLALARSTLLARQGDLREAEASYLRVVGEEPIDLVRPTRTASPILSQAGDIAALSQVIREATALAVDENPALEVVNAEVDAADAAARGARAGYWPEFALEASMNRDGEIAGVPGYRNTDAIMLVARWNLYRGGADQALEMAAVERKLAARDAAADTRRAVEESAAIAVQAKATTELRMAPVREHVRSSHETLSAYESQRELGRRTLLDLLNARSEYFTAQSNETNVFFDDILNHYFVQASQGQLVKGLGLAAD